jgi:cell division septation protein DedD
MSPQIFTIIKSSLMDPDMEELPTDYNAGLDFRVTKTQKGGYADYTTSNWARKESALTDLEQAAVNEHGLYTLGDFLPKRPGEHELKVMKEMFEASVDGRQYDPERWGAYYRPAGMQAPQNAPTAPASSTPTPTATPTPVAAPVVETAPEPTVAPAPEVATAPAPAPEPVAETAAAPAGGSKAEDILAMIRSRGK